MSINYVYKVKKGIHKVIYDKLYFNCSTFRKMHYEVSITKKITMNTQKDLDFLVNKEKNTDSETAQ